MIPTTYRLAQTCASCKHSIGYMHADSHALYCGIDGTKHPLECGPAMITPAYHCTETELDLADDWEFCHGVEDYGTCEEWVLR